MKPVLLTAVLLAASVARAEPPLSLTEEGEIHLGDKVLTQRELYEVTGRTDLAAKSDRNRRLRPWLLGGAVVSGVALVGSGIAVLATTPDITLAYCVSTVQRYNEECVPQVRLHQTLGSALLVSGIVASTLLFSIASWNRPDILSRNEVEDLIDTHNASRQPKAEVDVVPVLDPRMVGLLINGRF